MNVSFLPQLVACRQRGGGRWQPCNDNAGQFKVEVGDGRLSHEPELPGTGPAKSFL